MPMYRKVSVRSATIASGGSQSGEITVNDGRVTGIQMPADWDAANLTALGSNAEGGTFYPIYDSDGNELTISAADDRYLSLSAAEQELLSAPKVIKLRSGTAGAPVNQTADRALSVILK